MATGVLHKLARLLRRRGRPRDVVGRRVLVGFSGVAFASLTDFEARLAKLAAEHPEILWFEVNPYVRRVVFALSERSLGVTPDTLEALVERAERGCPIGHELPDERELPDDVLLELQYVLELLADTAGLGFGLTLRPFPFTPKSLGASLVFALTAVQQDARLRASLDGRFGRKRADLLLNLTRAFFQGLSQRPVSSSVDIGYRLSVLREYRARRRTYQRRRAMLVRSPARPTVPPRASIPPNPEQTPRGPFERYRERMWIPAASAYAVGLLGTRSPLQAVTALFSALPTPARVGRDFFANEVGRALGERGALVLSLDAIRRLDRIDCVVVDGKLLTEARFQIGRVVGLDELSDDDARARVMALFDARRPLEVQTCERADGMRLAPLGALDVAMSQQQRALTDQLVDSGELILGLATRDRVIALAEVKIRRGLGVEELLRTAEEGGLRVLIASDSPEGLAHLGQDYDLLPARDPAAVRKLQRAGHAVCYVADGPSPALATADCAVGICQPDRAPPWAAHVLCNPSLEELRTLLKACLLSRGVSRQSVNLAMGATAIGTLVSTGGLSETSRRVMLVVNVASVVSMTNALRKAAPLQADRVGPPLDPTPFHALEARGVLARLDSQGSGLTRAKAEARKRARVGDVSALDELGQAISAELLNPLSPLLAAGAGVSAVVGSTLDACIVAGVGGFNALISGAQRFRTERKIRHLVQPVELSVQALRDGAPRPISSADLVVGDVIELSAGELVPADCRLLEAEELEIDSSSLTGESLPVPKRADPSFAQGVADRACMLYAGTEVVAGRCRAVVVAIGERVEAQRAARVVELVTPETGVEARLRELIRLTGPVAASGGLAVMAAGLLRGKRAQDVVGSGVSMAVAAIPEGLPVLAGAAQLSAARRLSQKGALVRNTRAIEALGRLDVICLDKTGTLTENAIELHLLSDGEISVAPRETGAGGRALLAAALRASVVDAQTARAPSTTDAALRRVAADLGVTAHADTPGLRKRQDFPFESGRGFHAVVADTDGDALLSIKGAPELLLCRCDHWRRLDGQVQGLDRTSRAALLAHASSLAADGLRVIAVAERSPFPQEADPLAAAGLTFRGLIAFRNAPRDTAAKTIRDLRTAGIEVVMLTGDHLATACRIARDVDLLRGRACLTGAEVADMDDEALQRRAPEVGVFARVTPAQKVRIVRALSESGRVVAMVGDGANDAPALRAAAVGVAVGERAAAAARAAADIVFADTGIETLREGVVEARAMWLSVRDAVSILIGGNLGEIGFEVTGGLLAGRPPLNPRQILLVNFLTDVAPALAVALRRPPHAVYERLKGSYRQEGFEAALDREIAIRAVSTGLGATWAWGLGRLTGTRARASTMGLTALVGAQLGQTLLSRGSDRRVTWTSLLSWLVMAGIVQTPGLSHLFGCRPIGPLAWSIAFGSSVAATLTSAAATALDQRLSAWLDVRDNGVENAIRVESTVRDVAPEAIAARALSLGEVSNIK